MRQTYLNRVSAAVEDLYRGLERAELWLSLGWHDIRQRYRRSIVGPFWVTISMALMIAGIGYLSVGILNQRVDDHLPYLSAGIIIFGLISMLVTEGCNVFIDATRPILQIKAPLSIYVYQMIWRCLIVFAHNITIYFVVMIMFGLNPWPSALLALVGLSAIAVNGFFLAFILGGLGARFRDVPLICGNLMQVAFFISPVFWRPSQAQNQLFVELNPFYYFLESVRMPLMGDTPPASLWIVLTVITALNAVMSVAFYARVRSRIPYWL